MGTKAKSVDDGVSATSTRRQYFCTMDKPLGVEKYVANRVWAAVAHVLGIYGWYLLIWGHVPRWVVIPMTFYGYFAGLGTTMGAHRLWAHKTYKAKLPLRLILTYAQTAAVQYPIFKWCRDHRLHHKYVETDADPHNALKGFFFSHMGWLFVPENPAVKAKEDTIDMSDLDADPLIRFQTKYYFLLVPIAQQFVPGLIWHWLCPEISVWHLICLNFNWWLSSLHGTSLVNSAAHIFGDRPYDKSHAATENTLVSIIAVGEGSHNYHHVFPYDYKASEFGSYGTNVSCMLIDFFAKIGWAYDLKTVTKELVTSRILRTGDARLHADKYGDEQRFSNNEDNNNNGEESEALPPWGWGDKDISEKEVQMTKRIRPCKIG